MEKYKVVCVENKHLIMGNCEDLVGKIVNEAEKVSKDIVLDMGCVEGIGSTGISQLLSAYKNLGEHYKGLVLIKLKEKVNHDLVEIGLSDLFPRYANEEEYIEERLTAKRLNQ